MFREKAIKNAVGLDYSRKWPIYFPSLQDIVLFLDIKDISMFNFFWKKNIY